MKKDIHPQIYADVTVTCVCGNTFTTQSTVQNIQVDICSKCHPFYTGKQKFIDTEGRIDKFNKKVEVAKQSAQNKKDKKAKGSESGKGEQPQTLKDIFSGANK